VLKSAIILAGGFGTRLKSVVSDVPKPMAAVNARPFLDYQLDYLLHFGIREVCLSVGHLSEKIISHYGNSYKGLQFTYALEAEPLGTGGGIRLGLENTKEKEILVLNGDSFFEVDLKVFYQRHLKEKAQFSLALRKVDNASRYGAISFDGESRVVAFKEKSDTNAPGYINGGVYILNRDKYLQETEAKKNFSIEKDIFEKRLQDLKIMGFVFEAYFIDIGIPEDYMKAQDDFKGFKYK
jgi:D-glycero-alpha-D-manno-heptose 1-phosphate guanylyltransferase